MRASPRARRMGQRRRRFTKRYLAEAGGRAREKDPKKRETLRGSPFRDCGVN